MKILLTLAVVYLAIGFLVMLAFIVLGDFDWSIHAVSTLVSIVLFWPAWIAFIWVMRDL